MVGRILAGGVVLEERLGCGTARVGHVRVYNGGGISKCGLRCLVKEIKSQSGSLDLASDSLRKSLAPLGMTGHFGANRRSVISGRRLVGWLVWRGGWRRRCGLGRTSGYRGYGGSGQFGNRCRRGRRQRASLRRE